MPDSIEVLTERIAGLKELMTATFAANQSRYDDRFHAQEVAVTTALNAQEKFNAVVAADAKEAVGKAEASQRAVNERQNEFRGQLSDQAATLMPRKEYESAILAMRELIDREIKLLRADVANLRESRSEMGGQKTQSNENSDKNRWIVGTVIAVVSIAISVGLSLLIR